MAALHTGVEVRRACREGSLNGPTCGLAPGFAQANLVILPRDWAFDFLLFCQRNPQACPLLEVTEPGESTPPLTAPIADLRSDLPRYRVWQHGELIDEPTDIHRHWRDDFVSFLIGCSFTFEAALQRAGLPVRHLELGRNVPMFRTNIECTPAGRLHGPLVVSMPVRTGRCNLACRFRRRFNALTGHRCIWDFPSRSASAIFPSRITAKRCRYTPASCQCSGPAV